MIKKFLLAIGVAFILGLGLFAGIIQMLYGQLTSVIELIKYIPLEIRVIFFACWIALFWALYNAIVS